MSHAPAAPPASPAPPSRSSGRSRKIVRLVLMALTAVVLVDAIVFAVALVYAIGHSVAVGIEVGAAATALPGRGLVGIEVAFVETIGHTVAVRMDVGHTASALTGLEYTIDHARRRVVIHGRRLQTRLGDSAPPRPTLDVRLGCGRQAVRLVVDSGVAAPVLFEGGSRSSGIELGGVVHAATNAGDAVWREGRVAALCVAGRRTGPLRVVVRSEGAQPRSEHGLLPSRYFSSVRLGPDGSVVAVRHW